MRKEYSEIRKGIIQLLVRATPEHRRAVLALLPVAKQSLDNGFEPDVRGVPLHSWRCLLTLLAGIASGQADTDVYLRMSNDLLAVADRLVPPAEALRQCAQTLADYFHADLYVCRMRDKDGNWIITSAYATGDNPVPLLSTSIEESLLRHPVMRAVTHHHDLYIVSNDLHGIERGGDSFDCTNYIAGYRTRLAFVIREHFDETPFGLVMLYTRHEYGFEQYEERFLARTARLVNLAVGRRVGLARDTLEKAAGAMAHYGNNAINTMRVQAEYCGELVGDTDEQRARGLRLARELRAQLPPDSRAARLAAELEDTLLSMDLTELAAQLGGVLDGTRRMTRIIRSLEHSAERPRLLKYVSGENVLKLDDGRGEEQPEKPSFFDDE